jgi:HAE1 family hydrophobic/amphiphilic exporter-1
VEIIRFAIRNPITVAVGVILATLFGLVSLGFVPVQLTPTVDTPQVTVYTSWPGASPLEIEREIIDEQEEQLKSLDGLVKMESESHDGYGQIVMEFPVATDTDAMLIKVSNRLEQVPEYPSDADKPVIFTVDPSTQAVAWFIVSARPGYDIDISQLFDYIDDQVKPRLERVPGVAQSNIYGGRTREMQVIVDPDKLAVRNLTMTGVAAALSSENRDYSAGDFDEGKRRYIVRTAGDYRSAEDVEDVIISTTDGAPVHVHDIGRAELGYRKATAFVRHLGRPALALNALREPGTNVIEVMQGVYAAVEEIDRTVLEPQGLQMEMVYDQTTYIKSSIGLVESNIVVGGALAILVLLLFLRSASGTFVVAISIPISVISTFLVMTLAGRSINVISLAGMAFAVGMVVDNCIVVIENIFRHREMGKGRARASLDGTVEVWGAVLASTLTTVAVFLPVIYVSDEAGQLFRDIAIAISAAVTISLLVAMTVIPTMAARMLGKGIKAHGHPDAPAPSGNGAADAARHHIGRLAALGDRLFGHIPERIASVNAWISVSTLRRVVVIVTLTGVSLFGSWLLMPKAEYLPTGNSNFVIGIVLPPPGYNLEELEAMGVNIEADLAPMWEAEAGSAEAAGMPGGGIENFFYVAFGEQVFMGMRARNDTRVKELMPTLQAALGRLPGSIGIAVQPSIFQTGLGEGRSINVDLRGPELEKLIAAGGQMFGMIYDAIPGVQARPIPGLDLGSPEYRLKPDRRRMADVGLTNRELGFTVNALVDGAKVSDYRIEGREIDLVLKGDKRTFIFGQDLDSIPINTPSGHIVQLGSVADIDIIGGPVQVDHHDRVRAIRLSVVPPETMPLQEAMELLEEKVIEPARASGAIEPPIRVRLTGTADNLTRTRQALMGNFLVALAVTYLLMAALFQSWVYPLVILFSVPLAALGGFLGLWAVNVFISYQPMDILTMLGFVILIGIVVNNAILIVHQSLNLIRHEGMPPPEAIPEAVRTRVRPIFMSTATSVFGMLPLVLFPGAGSELYRGLGSVVIGGLTLSTIFTLFLVPALLGITIDAKRRLRPVRSGEAAGEDIDQAVA